MESREHVKLLVEVAELYWVEEKDQAEIARRIGYSRSMVSRLLSEARQRGIITFTVSHPLERVLDAEDRLIQKYGLRAARVSASVGVDAPGDVAQLAADTLRGQVTSDYVVALTNGRAVSAVVDQLKPLRRSRVTAVQALGTVSLENQIVDSPEMCRRFAARLHSRYRLLPAPLVVGSVPLARALLAEESVSATLSMAAHADAMLTGIGSSAPNEVGSIFRGLLRPAEYRGLTRAGAVGHVCGHHIDRNGMDIDSGLCRRLIAVPFRRLLEIPNVIAVAWGEEKVVPIRAALAGGIVNTLVTDIMTAEAVLGEG